MFKNLIRGGVTGLGFLLGVGVFQLLRYISEHGSGFLGGFSGTILTIIMVASGVVFALLLFLLFPVIASHSAKIASRLDKEIRHLSAVELMTGVAGLIIGLVIAYLVASPIVSIINIRNTNVSIAVTIVVYLVFVWLGVVIGTRKGKDVVAALSRMREDIAAGRASQPPKTPAQKPGSAAPKILDTSVIIDGRIADILKTGFVEGRIIIPDFVLVELRHIADSSDSLKRARGRRGLDVLNRIQNDFGIEIYQTANEKSLEGVAEVDVKLLKLAKHLKGKVVTNDFNLNKVAMIQSVGVLNINELANHLKPVVLPGEEMTLFLVKEGKEHGQAVAYLDDGTMIVVEDGRKSIGNTVDVTVTSVLQTAAGRMIFGRLKQGRHGSG
ncbi:MAG: PIN domain-containing protein [Clostridiales bacterium]|nr:PIN domain-containing protein [Clostridiales bacterium]